MCILEQNIRVKKIYSYDEFNNISNINILNKDITYNRDIYSNITSINNTLKNTSTNVSYDSTQRLSSYDNINFIYDANSNCLNNDALYNNNNQLLSNDNFEYTYDTNGNLNKTKDLKANQTTLYTYSSLNQLTSIRVIDNKSQDLVKSFVFTYDDLNRRISKTINANTTYHYIYDNLNIVAILDNNKELLASISHNDNLIDSPICITNHNTNKTYFYHKDANNSVMFLTNQEGKIVEDFTYDAYGKIINHQKDEETFNIFAYNAREFDTFSLYYYRFRYYDASTSRFLSLDPISHESNDFNHYRYVFNNPVNKNDALGLDSVSYPLNTCTSGAGATAPTNYSQVASQSAQANTKTKTSLPDNPDQKNSVTKKLNTGFTVAKSADGAKSEVEPCCQVVPWEITQKDREYTLKMTEEKDGKYALAKSEEQEIGAYALHIIKPKKDEFIEITSTHTIKSKEDGKLKVLVDSITLKEQKELKENETFKIDFEGKIDGAKSTGKYKPEDESEINHNDPSFNKMNTEKILKILKSIINPDEHSAQLEVYPYHEEKKCKVPMAIIYMHDKSTYSGFIEMKFNFNKKEKLDIDAINKKNWKTTKVAVEKDLFEISGKISYIKGDTEYIIDGKSTSQKATKLARQKSQFKKLKGSKRIENYNAKYLFSKQRNSINKILNKLMYMKNTVNKNTPIKFDLGDTAFKIEVEGGLHENKKSYDLNRELEKFKVSITLFSGVSITMDILFYIKKISTTLASFIKKVESKKSAKKSGEKSAFSGEIKLELKVDGGLEGYLEVTKKDNKNTNTAALSGSIGFGLEGLVEASIDTFIVKYTGGIILKTASKDSILDSSQLKLSASFTKENDKDAHIKSNFEFTGVYIYYAMYSKLGAKRGTENQNSGGPFDEKESESKLTFSKNSVEVIPKIDPIDIIDVPITSLLN